MTHNVTLPNGFTMTGVPDDATQEEIAAHAIQKGYARPEDFRDFPAVYAQVAPTHESTVTAPDLAGVNLLDTQAVTQRLINAGVGNVAAAQRDGLMPTEQQMEESKDAAQLAALTLAPELIPEWSSLGLGGKILSMGGANAALGAAYHGNADRLGADFIEGAGGEGAGEVLAPVVGAIFRRLSPRAAATAKGMSDAGAFEPEVMNEVVRDVPPRPEPEATSEKPIETVEQGADRARAQQALIDQEFMEHATRLHSAIEGTSYAGASLKAAKTGAAGQDAADALKFYRDAIGGYESGVLPHMGEVEGFEHLKGLPYYEALMRSDVGELDNLISQIDQGVAVDPAHFLNALEAYQIQAQAALKAFTRKQPAVWVAGLENLLKAHPDIDSLVSEAARMGLAPEKMGQKMVTDYQQAFTAAVKDTADKLETDLLNRASDYRVEAAKLLRESRSNPRLRSVVKAMNHSADTMEKMASNVADAMHNGRMGGGEDWEGIGMLRSMAATHDIPELEKLYQRYRSVRSGFFALPEARAKMDKTPFMETAMDALETALTVKTLGANKVIKKVAGRPLKKQIAKPVERVRRKVRRRQAIKDINELVEKSKG